MKKCPHCSSELKEYVGLNARAGDPDNPWDCHYEGCKPREAAESTGWSWSLTDLYESLGYDVPAPTWTFKPIQSAPTQTPSKSPATGASSQTPHTQLSPLAARHIVADAQRQVTQDLCLDVLGGYTPPQRESGQPQTSDKPTQVLLCLGQSKASLYNHYTVEEYNKARQRMAQAFREAFGEE